MSITKTGIAGVSLDSYVMNASGPLDSSYDELELIAISGSSAIMMKSCTINSRIGNDEPRYVRTDIGSLQSMGLPNLGYRSYIKFAEELQKYNKPVIASIAGFSNDDYRVMVEEFQYSNVSLIEINLSCPNISGKSVLGYDFERTKETLEGLSDYGSIPLGLKLPPYFDLYQFDSMADIIRDYNIKFITCINSVANTLLINPETESAMIKPRKGLGGLGGSYIKPIALGNVRIFYDLLKDDVSIIGVGGIESGLDAFEFLLAGADAVQLGTAFEKEGHNVFSKINNELEDIMKHKSYTNIISVKGKLKFL